MYFFFGMDFSILQLVDFQLITSVWVSQGTANLPLVYQPCSCVSLEDPNLWTLAWLLTPNAFELAISSAYEVPS